MSELFLSGLPVLRVENESVLGVSYDLVYLYIVFFLLHIIYTYQLYLCFLTFYNRSASHHGNGLIKSIIR